MSEEKREGYTANLWNQVTNYTCSDCAFATLDSALIAEHRRLVHAERPSPAEAAQVHQEALRRALALATSERASARAIMESCAKAIDEINAQIKRLQSDAEQAGRDERAEASRRATAKTQATTKQAAVAGKE